MKRTVLYFNRESEARKALKKYGKGYAVRQHPKWHTWDVVKVIPKRRKPGYGFGIPRLIIPKIRF